MAPQSRGGNRAEAVDTLIYGFRILIPMSRGSLFGLCLSHSIRQEHVVQRLCLGIAMSLAYFCCLGAHHASAGTDGPLYEVTYPASNTAGELIFGVTYTVWIPESKQPLRGIIVHQHGCGSGACKGGGTAAYDLHWQALARKWNCALLGPSYHQQDGEDCRKWCDPRNGSAKTFLKSLEDLAVLSGRRELTTVPWCLWGHSGGGFWASIMQTLYPERIIAIWFRSGTAIEVWERGEIPQVTVSPACSKIPMVVNPGVKERDDQRFRSAWTGAERMFHYYREMNAPIAMALDPKSGHECGDSRYLAIPFFDACLKLRLPGEGEPTGRLKSVDVDAGFLAPWLEGDAKPAGQFAGDPKTASWLPSAEVAKAWSQYVQRAAVDDATPPPAPFNVSAQAVASGVRIRWDAIADLESGTSHFIIYRDGVVIGQVPEKPIGRFGKGLFQTMSYHDTPEKPWADMVFVDRKPGADRTSQYQVKQVNTAGGTSPESTAAVLK